MTKRFVAFFLIVAILAGISCTSVADEFPPDDLTQHRSFTAWLYMDDYKYYSSAEDKPFVKVLNEKFNCDITFEQPPMGSEREAFNTMLGTCEYTDVMEVSYSQDAPSVLYQDGVIRDLAPYVATYMPNYYAWLTDPANADAYRTLFDAEGHLFLISSGVADDLQIEWGGLTYRHDILETMTGGNIAFPSGNAEPTTLDDLEYILALMDQYFQAAGMADYADLILPYNGFFSTGELLMGFGAAPDLYLGNDGKIAMGLVEENFYNYLVKMHEWYEKGWIYADFASRTNDVFYLPNPSLTYGGAAGVFFGGNWMLGDVMSMPEYGLNIDLRPMSAPLDTAHGIDGTQMRINGLDRFLGVTATSGWCVSTSCSDENMIRFMTWCDYLFDQGEGTILYNFGLNAEQAANDPVYISLGLEEGAYTIDENGTPIFVPEIKANGYDPGMLTGMRFPGFQMKKLENETADELWQIANDVWRKYGSDNNVPAGVIPSADDGTRLAAAITRYSDYVNAMVPKFIMGTEELTPETFKMFCEQVMNLGGAEAVEINQAAYDAYMSR